MSGTFLDVHPNRCGQVKVRAHDKGLAADRYLAGIHELTCGNRAAGLGPKILHPSGVCFGELVEQFVNYRHADGVPKVGEIAPGIRWEGGIDQRTAIFVEDENVGAEKDERRSRITKFLKSCVLAFGQQLLAGQFDAVLYECALRLHVVEAATHQIDSTVRCYRLADV